MMIMKSKHKSRRQAFNSDTYVYAQCVCYNTKYMICETPQTNLEILILSNKIRGDQMYNTIEDIEDTIS